MSSILILDDDPDLRDELAELIESYGFDAITASTIQEAIEVRQKNNPKAALIDVWLGRTSSLPLVAAWRNEGPAAPHIILLSGSELTDQERSLLDDLPPACLKKPIDVEALVKTLNGLIAH